MFERHHEVVLKLLLSFGRLEQRVTMVGLTVVVSCAVLVAVLAIVRRQEQGLQIAGIIQRLDYGDAQQVEMARDLRRLVLMTRTSTSTKP